MQKLSEKANRLGAVMRVHYRSDDTPTTHVEVYGTGFSFELYGDLDDLDEMCDTMYQVLDLVDPLADVPF